MCLTGKDHFIEFCKHSGMVNTKFNYTDKFITPVLWYDVNESLVLVAVQRYTINLSTIQSIGVLIFCNIISKTFNILWYIFAYKLIFKPWICFYGPSYSCRFLC